MSETLWAISGRARITLDELTAQRDALLAARYRGVRTVEIDGRRVTWVLTVWHYIGNGAHARWMAGRASIASCQRFTLG